MLSVIILIALIALFEHRHKDSKRRHSDALSAVERECKKLSERGLHKKRA